MAEQATPQEGTNPEVEVVLDETTTDEGTGETPGGESPQGQEEMVPRSQLNQAVARAHKAENEVKTLKGKPASAPGAESKPQINNPSLSEEDVDVKILISQGMDPNLVTDLKALAKARGKSVMETKNDPVFIAMKNQKEVETKAQKAKLGASQGSGGVRKEKSINTPGLSDTDHKAMWREQNQKK